MSKEIEKVIAFSKGLEKLEVIKKVTCSLYHIDELRVFENNRIKEIRRPRQIIQYLASQMTQLTVAEIGRRTGGKDHATVLHAKKIIEKEITPLSNGVIPDTDLLSDINTIKKSVNSYFSEQPVDISNIVAVLESTERVRHRLLNPQIRFDLDDTLDSEQRSRMDLSNPFIEIKTLSSTLEKIDELKEEILERLEVAKERKNNIYAA